MSITAFFEVGLSGSPVLIELPWISYGEGTIKGEFLLDSLTVSMLIPVMIISTCVQLYSLEYLKTDPHLARFMSYLSLFSFVMILLVTGDNLFIIFLGWEGVGVVSALLVNFWFTGVNNNLASMKAFFINKIGDWALIIGIGLCMTVFGDISLSTIFASSNQIDPNLCLIVVVCFIIGASAKSAQISLHTWLAAAMAGPTPVSSLLHSSTMVTAGIYLLLRISPLLEGSESALILLIWLGSLTALFGAACGLVENDIKKIIAYSTSSQLGYMVVAIGVSQYSLALFHLINHAFFKSLLFLSAGAFIHGVLDQQDIRKMGSLALFTPITYGVFLLGSFSLMAFPFFTGFYSKDL
jgi:NADH-ubiquinone oxidoreductase chain 5